MKEKGIFISDLNNDFNPIKNFENENIFSKLKEKEDI